MPSSETILAGLKLIANQAQSAAALWHIAVFIALLALGAGWRPSRRTLALGLVLPLLSVAIVAAAFQGIFNGVAFTLLGLALAWLGRRVPVDRPASPPRGWLASGIALAAFGFVYPHFLQTSSFFGFLYAAPLGILPCPTLAFAIGVTLIVDGVGSRAWALLLAGAGLFYGFFGVVKLGVWLDLGLVAGATGLTVRTLATRKFVEPRSACRGDL